MDLEFCPVKEAKLKRLHTAWLHLNDIMETLWRNSGDTEQLCGCQEIATKGQNRNLGSDGNVLFLDSGCSYTTGLHLSRFAEVYTEKW